VCEWWPERSKTCARNGRCSSGRANKVKVNEFLFQRLKMASKQTDDEEEYDNEYDAKGGDSKDNCHGGSSSFRDESKGGDRLTGPQLVEAVQNYFFTDENLSRTFENFVKDHCHVMDLNSSEFKLEYTQAYNEYKALFEDRMENYICNTLESSINDFYVALKTATESDENSNEAVFGLILLSVTDFDIFMQMMKEARQAQISSRK
jgi:hypothetical protein